MILSSSIFASDCPQLYPNKTPITIPNTIELCSSFFVVLYNPYMKATILTSEVVSATPKRPVRVGGFVADSRLPEHQRATNADYKRSGYDKGHMVPAGDANTVSQMKETFKLTNATPQVPSLNREAWRNLEHNIREWVNSTSDTWVLTIAKYDAKPPTIGSNKIPVPHGYYKIVYAVNGPKSFYADNAANAKVSEIPTINNGTLIGLQKTVSTP